MAREPGRSHRMTIRENLNLSNFAPALDQLAARIDNSAASCREIADAAMALSSGIIATAILQSPTADEDFSHPWEGSLDDSSLSIYSATHQLVFTLQSSVVVSAVLSGPSGLTWHIIKNEKGLYITGTSPDGTIFLESLITSDGTVQNPNDISPALQELGRELDQIGSLDEATLPSYIPQGTLTDVDYDSAADLGDLNSDFAGPGPGTSDPGGPQGSGSSGSPSSQTPFNAGSAFSSSDSSVGAGFSAVGAIAGAAAAAGVINLAGQLVGVSSVPPVVTGAAVGDSKWADAPVLILTNVIGERFETNRFPALVGRTADCHICLPGQQVSRQHARFSISDGHLKLEDLNSSNGTSLNGSRLSSDPVNVFKGDTVQFADIELLVFDGPEPKPQMPEPPAPENLKTVTFNMADKLQQQATKTPPAAAPRAPEAAPPAPPKPARPAAPSPAAPPAPAARPSSPPPAPSAPAGKPSVPPPPAAAPGPPPKASPPSAPPQQSSKPAAPPPQPNKQSIASAPPPVSPPPRSSGKSPAPATEAKCTSCNKPVAVDAKFCPACGAQQNATKQCSGCNKELQPDAKFCPDCGKPTSSSGDSSGKVNKAPPPAARSAPPPPAAKTPPTAEPSDNAEDFLAKAAEAARRKSAESPSAPEKQSRRAAASSSQWADEEPLTSEKMNTAPSLSWPAYIFGALMLADHIRMVARFGSGIADSERFTVGLGMGIALTFFAWVAGTSAGFFRFLTKVTALIFTGHQLYRDHQFIQHIMENPDLITTSPDNLLPFISLLVALWLFKRARNSGS